MVLDSFITKYCTDPNQKVVFEFEEIVKFIDAGELGESESNATRKFHVSKSTLVLPPNCAHSLGIAQTYISVVFRFCNT
jgi:hypothetical protein